MSKKRELEIWFHRAAELLFPVILLLFPLLKINQGVDLTDTPYSLGNYRFLKAARACGCSPPSCPMWRGIF